MRNPDLDEQKRALQKATNVLPNSCRCSRIENVETGADTRRKVSEPEVFTTFHLSAKLRTNFGTGVLLVHGA